MEKLVNIIKTWDFATLGKITQRAIYGSHPISKKTVEKYYDSVRDLITEKNERYKTMGFTEVDNGLVGSEARRGIKDQIIELRKSGMSYRKIEETLNCSKGTIAHHCENAGLKDIGIKHQVITEEKKKEIYEYTKTHTTPEAMEHFGIGRTAIKRYKFKRPQNLISDETRLAIKEYVKTHTIKETAQHFGVAINSVKKYR